MKTSTVMYQVSVIAPCFNEALNIPALVSRLQATFEKKKIRGEIILVNDASSDNTREVAESLCVMSVNVRLVNHETNRGIAEAWRSGVRIATGAFVCFIDADLQNLPEDVWRLYQEITFTNVDFVSGWRSHVNPKRDLRYVASKSLNLLLNGLFGMTLRDNKSGFAIARREVMARILQQRFSYHHPQTFIAVSAHTKGYSISQIETLFAERKTGMSYLAGVSFVRQTWLTLVDVLKGLFEFRTLARPHADLRMFLKEHAASIRKHTITPLPFFRRARFFVYRWTFPFHHWMISQNSLRYLDDMHQSEWLSPEKIREYQEQRLRQVIMHAYRHSPYYRDVMNELGLTPEDIHTIADLQKLPIIDKRVVRENLFLGLMSNNHDKSLIQKATTSGSTGEPFFTYLEKDQIEMRYAATLRALEWTGWRFGDRQLRLWHKYLGLSMTQIMREVVDAFLMRRAFIPAYEMDEAGLEAFMRQISFAQPFIIDGYAESFNFIAKYLKRKKYEGFKPKAIMCSAQMLPEESRRTIEESFGCKVFDKYGAREFGGGIAYECGAHDGHHVVAECTIIEIIKDGQPAKPGELGEVIVTELNNFAAPLIRYRLGDLAVAVDEQTVCPCGRGLPRIGAIQGRIQSTIIGANGAFVPGSFFARLFADYEHAVKQFQVVQEKPGELTIKIVKGLQYEPRALDPIMRETLNHLGEKTEIRIEFVDQVALGRTGKRQHSLSKVEVGDILDRIAHT